jgi:threonine/homoserine/homoserine lactone efflux protein
LKDSNPNFFLSGAVLSGLAFIVLWLLFSCVIAISMVYWGHWFRPRWHENAVVIGGGAIPAWLAVKTLFHWIASRDPNASQGKRGRIWRQE